MWLIVRGLTGREELHKAAETVAVAPPDASNSLPGHGGLTQPRGTAPVPSAVPHSSLGTALLGLPQGQGLG